MKRERGHLIMRIVKVFVALPMILLFGILRLFATAISWLYCRASSLVFAPLVICLILAVIMTQWIAAGIFGAIIVACFISLFAIGWIEVELEFGQEFSKDLYIIDMAVIGDCINRQSFYTLEKSNFT